MKRLANLAYPYTNLLSIKLCSFLKITKSDADPPSFDFGANADDTYPPRVVLDINPLGVPKRQELNCLLEVMGIEEQGRSFRLRRPNVAPTNVAPPRVAGRMAGKWKDKKGISRKFDSAQAYIETELQTTITTLHSLILRDLN